MTSPGSQSKNKNHKPGSLSLDWTRITKYHNVDHYTTTVFIYIRQNYFVCLSYLPDTCVRLRDKMELLIWQFAKENVSFCSEMQVAEWQYIVSLSLSLFHFPFLSFFYITVAELQSIYCLQLLFTSNLFGFRTPFAQKSQSQNKNATNLRQQSLCNLNGIKMFFDVNGIIFCQKFLFLVFAFQFCMFWNEFCILSRFKILPVWIIWMALNYWTTRHPRLALRIDKILTTLSNTWTLVESTHRNKFDMQTYFCHLKQS